MDFLQADGIFSQGYGFIAKSVMQNRELSLISKALYSYICSYTGSGKTAFPSRDKICFDLDISKDTFHKHMKPLLELGFIVIEKEKKSNGTFANNLYKVISKPCRTSPDTVPPDTVKSDTKSNSLKSNITKKKKTTTTGEQIENKKNKSEASRSSLEFLNEKEFEKINAPTRANIIKNFPDLTRDQLLNIYTLVEKEVNSGIAKDFNAVLFKALKGEWTFKTITGSKRIEKDPKSADIKRLNIQLNYIIGAAEACAWDFEYTVKTFQESVISCDKSLVSEYSEKLKAYLLSGGRN